MSTDIAEIPRGNAAGFKKYFREDCASGLLVFLIALPLCLGISLASGFPPLAGIFTAIIGSILTTFISNSELTIKGPAAGLIVIVAGCVEEFGGNGTSDAAGADLAAYKMALAVGVAAAVLQIVFAVFRAGILGEFFPVSAVHGMLAAIGVIIISKQIPFVLGVSAKGEPLTLLKNIPRFIMEANPAIAAIGIVSLLIMFFWPVMRKKVTALKSIPGPLVVLIVAIPMGMAFDLLHEHSYVLQGHKYQLSEQYLVKMPSKMFGMFDELTFPDFTALQQPVAWKWVFMFFVIGSLESLLSAKAVDIIDPWKRKTNLDRDVLGVGIANFFTSMVGGLPMISEIVRSKANIDNGARTRFADMWHGIFLLVCVAFIPTVLHRIPLASLAAMLVYTGSRLAHPSEFMHVYHIGREQLAIFVTTLIAVLATDLLVGIGIGIALKMFIHVVNGVPLKSLFKSYLDVEQHDAQTCIIRTKQSAVFSNWIPFRRQIEDLGLTQHQNLIIDLSGSKLVDHTVMDKLHNMQRDFEQEGLKLEIVGLDAHQPLAHHAQAARKKGFARLRRVTIIANASLEEQLERALVDQGASGYTAIACTGSGRRELESGRWNRDAQIRIEAVVLPEVCDAIVSYLRCEVMPYHAVTACVETVEVMRREQFEPMSALPHEVQEEQHV